MVKRLIVPVSLLLLSVFVMAEPVSLSEKHYRQAAWAFYQQQPASALEALQLAPQQDGRTRLLEAGLYLQLAMPQHAATALEQVLAQPADDNAVPQALKNIALLQFARYQLELGNKTAARQYLQQVNITADGAWRGQQQLLSQLIHWPDISVPPQPDFVSLADQPEMPYVISNQALVLAQTDQSDTALDWLAQIRQQLKTSEGQGFWQLLFSGQWHLLSEPDGFIYPGAEREALSPRAVHIKHTGLAAFNAVASHQKHRHPVHTIAVSPFGCRAANAVGGVDAELVGLGEPGLVALGRRSHLRQPRQQFLPSVLLHNHRRHRLKPALHAAMQSVVGHGLPMGAVGYCLHSMGVDLKTGMPTTAVTPPVFQILVGRQIMPAGFKCLQGRHGHTGQLAYAGHTQHGKPLYRQGGVQLIGRSQRGLQRLLRHGSIRKFKQSRQA